MGKKQSQKDRLFLTTKEWKEEWGGFKEKSRVPAQRLPFYCCALSFTSFEDPVCTEDGTVFEVTNIVPYIAKHHSHPVTGARLELGELISLTFHKNADGEYECPVLKKVFTKFTHIVAIRTSGNVYAYEAVQKFNVKLKSWNDLLSNEPFTRADIIHIQRPENGAAPVTAEFDHVKRGLTAHDDAESESVIRNGNATLHKVMTTLKEARADSGHDIQEPTSRRAVAMAQLEAAIRSKKLASSKTAAHHTQGSTSKPDAVPESKEAAAPDAEEDDWRLRGPEARPLTAAYKPGTSTWDTDDAKEARRKVGRKALAEARREEASAARARAQRVVPSEWWHANYAPRYKESVETVGAASRALTSTVSAVVTKNERARILVHRDPKEKGYLTLNTSKGHLNIELHCDLVPRACENFLALCEMGYYDNVAFHRSIRNFMVQGGDPTEKGTGGESIYGRHFNDEIESRLVHDRRGVLAMANSGKNTNGSQFYILYKSARHLDYKHVVFGAVVGGMETLTAIETVKTDADDRLLERVEITGPLLCARVLPYALFVGLGAGVTIHRNPYRDMMEQERAADAAATEPQAPAHGGASISFNPLSSLPSPSQQQVPKRGAPESAAGALPALGAKRAKPSEVSEFDAW